MIKKIILFLKKIWGEENNLFFIGSSDKLPEPLNKEEEMTLINKSLENDIMAREKLIEHNIRLVVFLAKKYENTNIDLEDLVSIGSIGIYSFNQTNRTDTN